MCPSVAPGNPKVGVMLPYAPVQLLLFDYRDETAVSDCLVMTQRQHLRELPSAGTMRTPGENCWGFVM